MLKITKLTRQTFGILPSVSRNQYSTFHQDSFQNSMQIPRSQSYLCEPAHLHKQGLSKQVHYLTRRACTSHTTSTHVADGFILRPATHADCDAVKNIDRNVGSGFDTLLYCFHESISMKAKFNQVLEKSEQVVGYACGHGIDDGDALVLQHGRIAVEHRGKVHRKLLLGLLDAALSEYPHLQKMLNSSIDEGNVRNRIVKQPLRKLIMQRPVESFLMNTDELETLCQSELYQCLEEKFNTDAISGFPKREALRLLTEEIYHLQFAPLVPMIGFQPSGWKASTLGNQLQITDLFVSRCPWTNEIRAFSFMTITRGDYGVETNSEFYCDGKTGSEDLAIAHLLHYIREMALLLSDTKIVCCFHHPATVSRECVKYVLNTELGIPSNIHNDWTARMYECSVVDTHRLRKGC